MYISYTDPMGHTTHHFQLKIFSHRKSWAKGTGHIQCEGNSWVEGTPRQHTRTIGATDDTEADSQCIILALLLLVFPRT